MIQKVRTFINDLRLTQSARQAFEADSDSRVARTVRTFTQQVSSLRDLVAQIFIGGRAQRYVQYFTGWVFSCIAACAEATADLVWAVKLRGLKENTDAPMMHWFRLLMENPNPAIPWVTWKTIIRLIRAWRDIEGEAYVWAPKNGHDKPSQLWVVPPYLVEPYFHEESDQQTGERVGRFRFRWTQTQKAIPDGEIVYFPRIQPSADLMRGMTRGQGLVAMALDVIEIERYIKGYLRSYFAKNAMPEFVIESEGEIHGTDYEQFLKTWLEKHQGVEAGRPLGFMPQGWKLREINTTANKKMLQEMGQQNLTAIRGIWRVPLGILTGEFNSTAPATEAVQQHFIFKKYTIAPDAGEIAAIWTRWIQEYHDRTAILEVEPVEWSDPNEVRADELHRLKTGRVTINELRQENDELPIPATEGGDLLMIGDTLDPLVEKVPVAGVANELRATVGGATALQDLVKAYSAGEIERASALALATELYGFELTIANKLFPEIEEPEPELPPAGDPILPEKVQPEEVPQ